MLLSLESIAKSFGETPVLENVSLTLGRGQSVAVVAPSGRGKSTLLSIAGLLMTPTTGALTVNGRDAAALNDDERSALRGGFIGFLFQHPQLVGTLTAWENVALAASFASTVAEAAVTTDTACAAGGADNATNAIADGSIAHGAAGHCIDASLWHERDFVEQRAKDALRALGLEDKLDAYPRQLSIGQRRRVATARALLLDPPLIIADEPTNDLDSANAALVVEALFAPVAVGRSGLLLATHDEALAARADRLYEIAVPSGAIEQDEDALNLKSC